MAEVAEWFATAVGHHQAGGWPEAEQYYRQVLTVEPDHVMALTNLGLLLLAIGRRSESRNCLQRAADLEPEIPELHNNLGTVLVEEGRLDDAWAAFERALALRPEYAEAEAGRGNVLKERGKFGEAIPLYERALKLNPNLANVRCNLGNALLEIRKLEPAAAAFQQALQGEPNHAFARFGLGNVYLQQARLEEAETCFRQTIAIKPNYAEAYVNLAAALGKVENWTEIVACCQKAVTLRPDYAEAHLNLAIALLHLRKLDGALASCKRALELDPQLASAHSTQGTILKGLARLEEAVAAYRQALAIQPDFWLNHSALIYGMYFCPTLNSAAIYQEHRRWNDQHAKPLATAIAPHKNNRSPERRLRIGYVSPDFRQHCQSHFTVPLFSHHDHQRFEIFCYSTTARPDEITNRLRSYADQWRDVAGNSAEQVAQIVHDDHIDILVDLTMHMAKGMPLLIARKPAPVQVCWLAYPGTSGLSAMDYRISDPHLDPTAMFEQFYSEQTWRLPNSFWCYAPLSAEEDIGSLPALAKGHVTFGCLNNFCKVSEAVLRIWTGVMRAVEGSQLILLAPEGSSREHVLQILQQEQVAPERVKFVPFQSRSDYLRTYREIDIGLETLPYNGHTTSLDAFWMGVPVPTIVGQTAVGRAGLSLLQNLDLPELVAQKPEEYVGLVSGLASDLDRLAALRAGLRARMQSSPLMDGKEFARDMEAAYRSMWRRWCGLDSEG